MKKIVSITSAAAVLLAAMTACNKDSRLTLPDREEASEFSIYAYTEGQNPTRSTLDNSGYATGADATISWDEGDELLVVQGGNRFKFVADESGERAKFTLQGSDTPTSDPVVALFPYNSAATVSGTTISTVIPTTQTAVAGSFAHDANVAVTYSTNPGTLQFKNAVAYVRVGFNTSLEGVSIAKLTLKGLSSESLSGSVQISMTVADGTASEVATTVTEGTDYVELVPASGTLSAGTDYYLAVAPGSLTEGYQIILTDANGVEFSRTFAAANAQLQRNVIAGIGRKKLENFTAEVYLRVLRADYSADSSADYVIAYKDGEEYRVFNPEKCKDEAHIQAVQATDEYRAINNDKMNHCLALVGMGGDSALLQNIYKTVRNMCGGDYNTAADGLVLATDQIIALLDDTDNIIKLGSSTDGVDIQATLAGYDLNVDLRSISLLWDNNDEVRLNGYMSEERVNEFANLVAEKVGGFLGRIAGSMVASILGDPFQVGYTTKPGNDSAFGNCFVFVHSTIYPDTSANDQNVQYCKLYKKQTLSYSEFTEVLNQ